MKATVRLFRCPAVPTFLFVLALLCFPVAALFGQSFEGQITGKVTDTSGAVVPPVRLTTTNLATKTAYSATTNQDGLYRFPTLPPGQYQISCSFTGFKKFRQRPITIQVAQIFELNIRLVPGDISEQITVSTAPPTSMKGRTVRHRERLALRALSRRVPMRRRPARWAAMVWLGDASSGFINAIDPISTQGLYFAVYAQDDWKVTDKLTINVGLRWDVGIGDREKYNRLATFDPGYTNPLGNVPGLPNLSGALQWIGGNNPANQQATDFLNFGPRFGFAYSMDSKTVLRGGYGIFFLPRNIQGNGDGAVEAIRTTNMANSLDNNITPYNTIDNPFPQGILPPLNDRNPLANVGQSIAAPEYAFRNGYSQSWSLGVQRELPWGMVLDAHYWGSKSNRLPVSWNIDQLPDQYLALGSHLNDSVPNPFYGIITTGSLGAKTTSRQQLLLPFPQYTGVTQVFVPAGNSTYHAGTLQVEKRLSTSLTFLLAYTRSKAIDDVRTPYDIYNRQWEKGLSSFDAPNQFRLSGVWGIPYGHDRHYGKSANPVLNFLLGNWNLNGILNIQSGFPFSITRSALVAPGANVQVANPTLAEWFNTSAFTVSPAFTYGNVGPVLTGVRTDPVRDVDAVLVKNFILKIGERQITTQFRSEFYNLFNHAQFAAPNGTITSQSFGVITSQANSPRDLQFGLKVSF